MTTKKNHVQTVNGSPDASFRRLKLLRSWPSTTFGKATRKEEELLQ